MSLKAKPFRHFDFKITCKLMFFDSLIPVLFCSRTYYQQQRGDDTFGNRTGSTTTRFGYTGREHDPDTGLMYYRARWYSPETGRFVSEDPIGFGGGINLYAYVGNNSVNLTDPSGNNALAREGFNRVAGYLLAKLIGRKAVSVATKIVTNPVTIGATVGAISNTGVYLAEKAVPAMCGKPVVTTKGIINAMLAGAIGGGIGAATAAYLKPGVFLSGVFGFVGDGIGQVVANAATGVKNLWDGVVPNALGGGIAGAAGRLASKSAHLAGDVAPWVYNVGFSSWGDALSTVFTRFSDYDQPYEPSADVCP
jgi:RHS repeat-associated protein